MNLNNGASRERRQERLQSQVDSGVDDRFGFCSDSLYSGSPGGGSDQETSEQRQAQGTSASTTGTSQKQEEKMRSRSMRTNRPGIGKPPKLRFQAGSFVRNKASGELFCVRIIYRDSGNPTEWLFVLEEREGLEPSGKTRELDRLLIAHEAAKGEDVTRSVVLWEPQRQSPFLNPELNLLMNSSVTVSNKQMLNEYEVVSSGEVE